MIFNKKIILASQSPRRLDLLQSVGFDVEVIPSPYEEVVDVNWDCRDVPAKLAEQKVIALLQNQKAYLENKIVLGADTIVVLENEILGKPSDRENAIYTLKRLSGKTHEVITGVYIYNNGKIESFSETTLVTFCSLNDSWIEYYVDHYNPLDKAGSYGIQDWIGRVGISSITGDYYNVMGLPLQTIMIKLF